MNSKMKRKICKGMKKPKNREFVKINKSIIHKKNPIINWEKIDEIY